MRSSTGKCLLYCIAVALSFSPLGVQSVSAQKIPLRGEAHHGTRGVEHEDADYRAKIEQIVSDRVGYVADIVLRWEASARERGRWDMNYAQDLFGALMKLQPENLLAAGEAPSYEAMMKVLMTGRGQTDLAKALGDATIDLVYTPVPPCRIVDTRNAGGLIPANTFRSFDADGTNFSSQGGVAMSCGIPFGVARAVAMSVSVTQPNVAGFFRGWSVSGAQPFASFLNFVAGETIANTFIMPIAPGAGADFNLYTANANAHAIIDVIGYFAAPVATALDCTTVQGPTIAVPFNAWTPVDVSCPAGRTVTGGGYDTIEGTLGYPGVWVTTVPNGNGWRAWVDNQTGGARNIFAYARCCRVPGR